VRGEEIWVYYGGSNDLHGEPPRHGEPTRRGISLAKIQKDRLVCLRAEEEGLVTTTPLSIKPDSLWINADATGGSLQVELVDPFDQVISGFSKDDCVPFTGDETEHWVRWKDDRGAAAGMGTGGLEDKMVSQSAGLLKIRVYLNNAKLFALYA
jgi:hypothetical protein